MKIKVGFTGLKNATATLFLDAVQDAKELANVTDKNFQSVGLAIARRRLGTNVFPISITR